MKKCGKCGHENSDDWRCCDSCGNDTFLEIHQPTDTTNNKAEEINRRMGINVTLGSTFAVDQFGFIRKGTVTIEDDKIIFSGKNHWSAIVRIGIFLFITIVPFLLFRFGLGIFPALVVVHYFCVSDGKLAVSKATITNVIRKKRQMKFKGKHPESGKIKKPVFKVDSIENAVILENELKVI